MLWRNPIIQSALSGALGGWLAWLLSEPLYRQLFTPSLAAERTLFANAVWVIPVGGALGATLGAAEGVALQSFALTWRGALIGAVLGLGGGEIGIMLGQLLFTQVAQLGWIGRASGWSIFGLFVASAEGARRSSWHGARNAALGGLGGGFIGGILFDLAAISADGALSRGIALIVLGLSIGALSAFAERVLAEGALVVTQGKQEGRVILLDKPRTIIGRDERNDVYLADPGIVPRHAEIRAEQNGFALVPLAGIIRVNHAAARHALLRAGDQIDLGVARLVYQAHHSAATRACPHCASKNRPHAKFCHQCGQVLNDE